MKQFTWIPVVSAIPADLREAGSGISGDLAEENAAIQAVFGSS